jgi:hypothetical protein
MIVNLYVDHLAATPPESAEEVWADTQQNPRVYSEAAVKLGLSKSEYKEFRERLLDGDAIYVKLPRRVDSMAGDHKGHVYVVRNARMTTAVMGWKIRLYDGKTIYVPQTCGNLSVVEPRYVPSKIIVVPHKRSHRVSHVAAAYVPYVPPITPVDVQPIVVTDTSGSPGISQPAPAPQAVAGPAPSNNTGLFAIPIIGGIIYGFTHHDSPPAPPPCSQGSNSEFACTK